MASYFVTRHAGARAWAQARGVEARFVERLDPAEVQTGDVVMGTLPIHRAAEVCARGARFEHLALDGPPEDRGDELDPARMDAAGARLVPFDVVPLAASPEDGPAPRGDGQVEGERFWPGLGRLAWFLAGYAAISIVVLTQAALYDLIRPAVGGTEAFSVRQGMWALLLFGIGAAVAGGLYSARHRVLSSVIRRSDRVPPARVVIQGLSDLDGEGGRWRKANLSGLAVARRLSLRDLLRAHDERGGAADPAALEGLEKFPWQQNLRALGPHLGEVEHLVVVTSDRSDGDYHLFASFIRHALARGGHAIRIHKAPVARVDFEDCEALAVALREAFQLARKVSREQRDVRRRHGAIGIDATAGQKVFAVAAAVATINRQLVFTYVNNSGKVRAFDASIQLGDFG